MKKNLIKLTILASLFVLFAGRFSAKAATNPDKLKYKEITSEQFFSNGDLSKWYSAINGYKITDVSILSIKDSILEFSYQIYSKEKYSVDIVDFSKKNNSLDSTWIERLNTAIDFFDFIQGHTLNGKYSLYVYFEKGNKSKIFLHNIESIPTQEEINAAEIKKQEHTAKVEAEKKINEILEAYNEVTVKLALESPVYFGQTVFLNPFSLKQGTSNPYSKEEHKIYIGYNEVIDSCFLYIKKHVPYNDINTILNLNLDDIETLKKALRKYKQWVKIAKENQAIISPPNDLGKKIPDLCIEIYSIEEIYTTVVLQGVKRTIKQPILEKFYFRVASYDVTTHTFMIFPEYFGDFSNIITFNETYADDLLAGLEKINADTIANIKAEINKKKEKQEKDKSLFN